MSIPLDQILPPSLLLPSHLSAQKYFLVCTLTIAAWDTLVLTPRTWRLTKSGEWPLLKIIFQILRYLMPIEFIITAVAFFDEDFTQNMCNKFYLFEPITTAILMVSASTAILIRLHAIYDHCRTVLGGLGGLLFLQVATQAVSLGFYRNVPLDVGQGCIAGPKHNWVGIYWVAPTLFYAAAFALAVRRSIQSLEVKHVGYWRLMLRDGLNFYGAILGVNLVNVLFWLIVKEKNPKPGLGDPVKTIVTSLAAVLTSTMTMRIILNVKGSLAQGGAYTVASGPSQGSNSGGGLGPGAGPGGAGIGAGGPGGGGGRGGVVSNTARTQGGTPIVQIGGSNATQTFTLEEMRGHSHGSPGRGMWPHAEEEEEKARDKDVGSDVIDVSGDPYGGNHGVKVTIDRQVDFGGRRRF